MNLYLIGHAFDYETEKVVKLFLLVVSQLLL